MVTRKINNARETCAVDSRKKKLNSTADDRIYFITKYRRKILFKENFTFNTILYLQNFCAKSSSLNAKTS